MYSFQQFVSICVELILERLAYSFDEFSCTMQNLVFFAILAEVFIQYKSIFKIIPFYNIIYTSFKEITVQRFELKKMISLLL